MYRLPVKFISGFSDINNIYGRKKMNLPIRLVTIDDYDQIPQGK